jgi:Peptidase family M23
MDRLIPIILVLGVTLVIPASFLWALGRQRETNRLRWLLETLYTGGFVLYVVLVGRWDWVGYYLRYVAAGAFIFVAIASYRRLPARRFTEPRQTGWRSEAGALATTAFVAALLVWTMSGRVYGDAPIRLASPLADGWFYIAQGGNSTIINYHNRVEPQQYAVDIVALNAFGVRARGLYPRTLERYVVYGATVRSPCDGTVTAIVDGLPDQIPPATDRENAAGNHVVIGCGDVNVLLAHLRAGSIGVRQGQSLSAGQPLAEVGNSGNTSEPHLHVHAVRPDSDDPRRGDAVPLLFDGAFPARNATFSSGTPRG